MTSLLILAIAIGTHAFFLVSSIIGYLEGRLGLLFPCLAGVSLICWILALFGVAGLIRQTKPTVGTIAEGQDSRNKGGATDV